MGHDENLLSQPFRASPKLRDMANLLLVRVDRYKPRARYCSCWALGNEISYAELIPNFWFDLSRTGRVGGSGALQKASGPLIGPAYRKLIM